MVTNVCNSNWHTRRERSVKPVSNWVCLTRFPITVRVRGSGQNYTPRISPPHSAADPLPPMANAKHAMLVGVEQELRPSDIAALPGPSPGLSIAGAISVAGLDAGAGTVTLHLRR